MNKVLLFGPYSGPITGQSISFQEVAKIFPDDSIVFDSTRFGDNKIINSLYTLLLLPFVFCFYNFDKVYFTCSRSGLGFVKDFQLIILSRLFKKKIINHLHGCDFKNFYQKYFLLEPIIVRTYNLVQTSIVLLPSMKQEFSEFPKMKLKVVGNSYPSDLSNTKVDLDGKIDQIVYLSNIMNSKGFFVFLEAMDQLLRSNKSIIVKIAGKPMGDNTMSLSETKLKAENRISLLSENFPNRFFYLGVVRGKEKIELLKDSSIFVLPSFYKTEAFPISIVEAMRLGCAIITTRHNYLGDIISKSNGGLIETKSTIDLKDRIEALLSNRDLLKRIQAYNMNEAKELYSPNIFNNSIKSIIENE